MRATCFVEKSSFPCRELSENPRRAWGPRGWAKTGLRNARGRIGGVSLDDDEWFAWAVQLNAMLQGFGYGAAKNRQGWAKPRKTAKRK